MNHFDELPGCGRNHVIEDKAIAAFQMRLNEIGGFILQASDRKDYGTDCQIEVMADGCPTIVAASALNVLKRFDESVLLQQQQAQTVQPDPMSWFQLATAYSNLRNWSGAIDAYERTLLLDPDSGETMFNLGGAHWNSDDAATAAEVWAAAKERFPDHELSAKLQLDFASLFSVSATGQPRR